MKYVYPVRRRRLSLLCFNTGTRNGHDNGNVKVDTMERVSIDLPPLINSLPPVLFFLTRNSSSSTFFLFSKREEENASMETCL
jgi:hypothetical protein